MTKTIRRRIEESLFKRLGLVIEDDDLIWCDARDILVCGGWRCGKSTRAAARTLRQLIRPINKGLIWLVGPDYEQAREEFRYLLEWLTQLNLLKKHTMPSDGPCTLETKTGWRVVTKSGQHPERLGSVAPYGVVMCEPGQMRPEVYQMVIGRLAEKRGWSFLAGTLEDDTSNPRWVWYEKLANLWLKNKPGDEQRAFILPSWSNKVIFPEGEKDSEIVRMRNTYSEYTFARRIAGVPIGVEHPCYPTLWESSEDIYVPLPKELRFTDGAIGVDYGTTETHPSAVVVVQQDGYARFWVRELWMGTGGNPDEIAAVVEGMKKRYDIYKVRTDPKQAVLAMKLNGVVANGSGPAPTEARIGLANGLLEDGFLFIEANGKETTKVYESMRRMRRIQDKKGRLVYDRALGDDAAQAVLYALEELRGEPMWAPNFGELGSIRQSWVQIPSRAGMVGRV